MRAMFHSKYGNLGGVVTQLMARETVLCEQDDIERIYSFGTDHGLSNMWPDTSPTFYGINAANFSRLLRRFKPDLVLSIDSPEIIPVARKIIGAGKVITEVHTTVQSGLVYLNNPTCRTEQYFVPSEYSRSIVSAYESVDAQNVTVIPNILSSEFSPCSHEGREIPRPIITWVGKLDEHKNWQLALEIVAGCRQPDFEFWVVGGETAREDVAQRFIQRSYDLGIHDRIRWIDRLDHADMPALYRLTSASGGAHLVTSSDESFGMTVAEAIACACPVIAPRIGALPELAHAPGVPAFFIPGSRREASSLLERQLTGNGPGDSALIQASNGIRERHNRNNAGATFIKALAEAAG